LLEEDEESHKDHSDVGTPTSTRRLQTLRVQLF